MILHVDMDAYYASIEERDDPQLRGKPVIVGGTPEGRGVVAAANYVARTFGVHSAMPAVTARRLCPGAVFLRGRMEHYAAVSRQIREIFHSYTPLVEPLSLDEAFLDVRGSRKLFGEPAEIGRRIKAEIQSELRLTASVGVAPNKFLAKIASDLEKPDGFCIVPADGVQEFLDPLPIGRIWGIGRAGLKRFTRLGVSTVAQLRGLSLDVLVDQFGSHGEHFWRLARGLDERRVVPDRDAKSISHETTFAEDVDDREVLAAWLMELTEQVARRLRNHDLRARTVQIKVRFADFRTITRAHTLAAPTHGTQDIWEAAATLLTRSLPDGAHAVRLLGLGVSGIDHSQRTQGLLFDAAAREQQTRIDEVSDQLRDQFGPAALRRGTSLEKE